jgi:hypothetical protein
MHVLYYETLMNTAVMHTVGLCSLHYVGTVGNVTEEANPVQSKKFMPRKKINQPKVFEAKLVTTLVMFAF